MKNVIPKQITTLAIVSYGYVKSGEINTHSNIHCVFTLEHPLHIMPIFLGGRALDNILRVIHVPKPQFTKPETQTGLIKSVMSFTSHLFAAATNSRRKLQVGNTMGKLFTLRQHFRTICAM